jgi:anaerobic ribonucleoside-triphosphate reductase activating protein
MTDPINVALVIERTGAEGPGERFAVWVQGCPLRCAGCCNPEMLLFVARAQREPAALAREAISQRALGVEGVTLLGGEPFSQAGPLAEFSRIVREAGLSVMVFTGHALEDLIARKDPDTDALLAATDLLVDGPYEAGRRSTTRRWIGSDNQRLHFLTGRYQPEDPRFAEGNTIELRMRGGVLSLNGWPVAGARTRVGDGR